MDESLTGASAAREPSPQDVMARIRGVFVDCMQLDVRPENLEYGQLLEQAAVLDSIAVLEFVAALEKEFGVSIEPKYLELNFLSDLPALAAYLEKTCAGRP